MTNDLVNLSQRERSIADFAERRKIAELIRNYGKPFADSVVPAAVQFQLDRIAAQYDIPILCFTQEMGFGDLAGGIKGRRGEDVLLFCTTQDEEDLLRTCFHEEAHLNQDMSLYQYDTIDGWNLCEINAWEAARVLAVKAGYPDLISLPYLEKKIDMLNLELDLLYRLSFILGISSAQKLHRALTYTLYLIDPSVSPALRELFGLTGEENEGKFLSMSDLAKFPDPDKLDQVLASMQRDILLRDAWIQGYGSHEPLELDADVSDTAVGQTLTMLMGALPNQEQTFNRKAFKRAGWMLPPMRVSVPRFADDNDSIVTWFNVEEANGRLEVFLALIQHLVQYAPGDYLRMTWRVPDLDDDNRIYQVELKYEGRQAEPAAPPQSWIIFCQFPKKASRYEREEQALRMYINGFCRWAGIVDGDDPIPTLLYLWANSVKPVSKKDLDKWFVKPEGIQWMQQEKQSR